MWYYSVYDTDFMYKYTVHYIIIFINALGS